MASDVPLRIIVGRLQGTINTLASIIAELGDSVALDGTTVTCDTLAIFRAKTAATLPSDSGVILLADVLGNAGIFNFDSGSVAADDGLNVVVDSSARRWVRQSGIV